MGFLFSIYNEILFRPLFNALVWFYNVLPWQDLGLAIAILTIAIRVILTPFLWKGQSAQRKMAELQPEIKKIQEELKHDREKQGRALMEFYAKHRVSPFSGCLMILIQLPILIALFQVFQKGFDPSELRLLYSFVANPGSLHPVSFGLIDLSKGNIFLGVIAAVTQYFQIKMSAPKSQAVAKANDFASIMQKQSLYIFPALILVWSYTLPSALTLYWTVLNVFAILQEILLKRLSKRPVS
jgi:YidC/Oxa1 family membrane protein insertase